MSNKKTIFISYGRDQEHPEDVELVIKIKEDLSKDFNVLMDLDRLKQGDDWEGKLSDDITESDWIVFFITPYSARRPDGYCLNELSYALYKNKSIAPIMIEEEVPPLSICRIQYLDLQGLKKDASTYDQKLQGLISVLNEEKKLDFEGAYASLYSSLYPLQFKSVIAKHIHGFVGRKWLYKKVDHWIKEETDSRVLWITAEAGYGKTALAVYLSEKHPSSISIHFCQHDYRESRDPIQMLKVLIYELSTQVEEYSKRLLDIDIQEKLAGSATNVFQELLVEPLLNISSPEKNMFFIIDALDEAQEDNGKNPIMELISNRFADLPSWLNIIVTSRPEPELIRKLKKFNPMELKADEENNIGDLKFFIHKQLKDIDNLVVDALIKKCEGNMLYLKSILKSDSIKIDNFSFENIENLPQGMEALYQQYFERKFENIDYYEENFLDFVNTLVASGQGLPAELIKEILNMSDREYLKVVSAFGSLLEDHNGAITFYHKSLFDWLSDYKLSGDYSVELNDGYNVIYEYFKNDIKNKKYHKKFNLIIYTLAKLNKVNDILEYFDSRDYRDKSSLLNFLITNEDINPLAILELFNNDEKLEQMIIDELYNIAYSSINSGIFDLTIIKKVLVYFEPYLDEHPYWFFKFISKVNGYPMKLDGFFKSSASDLQYSGARDFNPEKVSLYLLLLDLIEKIETKGHKVPLDIIEFICILREASIYLEGKYYPNNYLRYYKKVFKNNEEIGIIL